MSQRRGYGRDAHSILEQATIPFRNVKEFPTDYLSLSRLDVEMLSNILGDRDRAGQAYESIFSALDRADEEFLGRFPQIGHRTYFKRLAKFSGKRVFLLTQDDVRDNEMPDWGEGGLFKQSFGQLFVSYRDKWLKNRLKRTSAFDGSQVEYLEDRDFNELYGDPPWQVVNEALVSAGLDFRISEPNMYEYEGYQPHLIKNTTGKPVDFEGLSSGEKILASLAVCAFYARDERQPAEVPSVILFDEIDAALHPAMSRQMLNVILSVLVDKFQLKVVATTHSPSTVALAPDESIYLMQSDGPSLQKVAKSRALNALTSGVPTLALTFEGRRQVFVESPADAATYDLLYKLAKNRISSERSLQFVATGSRSASGMEQNTGCDNVKRLVSELVDAGNTSVFGLIDWDGHHVPTDRIAVLAHERRNGLENIIFDPLLLCALICRDCSDRKSAIGMPQELRFPSFITLDADQIEPYVANLSKIVFGNDPTEQVASRYAAGFSIKIDKRFFVTDDHALEDMIVNAFPLLHRITKKQAGKLMQHVISTVLADAGHFMPIEILDAMKFLLEQPAH